MIPAPVLVQLCMGVSWGAPDDLNTFMAMVNNVPTGWIFSAFGLGRNEMPYVAGGNVRVGLEDNLWLDKGVPATNEALVERARTIIENMGARVIGPDEARAKLKLESGRGVSGVSRIALIGGGVIGGGWAASLIENGLDISVFDPDPQAERKLSAVLAGADRAYAKHAMAARPETGAVRFAPSIAAAAGDADLVIESAPERLDVKRQVFAEIEAANPTAVIASSTSGIMPTELQAELTHPAG